MKKTIVTGLAFSAAAASTLVAGRSEVTNARHSEPAETPVPVKGLETQREHALRELGIASVFSDGLAHCIAMADNGKEPQAFNTDAARHGNHIQLALGGKNAQEIGKVLNRKVERIGKTTYVFHPFGSFVETAPVVTA